MSGRPSWKSAEIGQNRPFSAFFALFRRVPRAPGKSRKRRKKAFFLRYPRISLNPHLLNPHLRHSNELFRWHSSCVRSCYTPYPVLPKGPFRTKNTTTIAKIVNYYTVVFLLRPPNLVRHGPFLERTHVCNSQENGARTRRTAIVNHPAVLKVLRVVNLLRVVFLVRRGPLGSLPWFWFFFFYIKGKPQIC